MDNRLLYALSLFDILSDKDKDEVISLMLSFPVRQESVSDQKD